MRPVIFGLICLCVNYLANALSSTLYAPPLTLLFSSIGTAGISLVLLLGVAVALDERVTKRRNLRGETFQLDREGVATLNIDLQLETLILHEDEPADRFSFYADGLSADDESLLEERFSEYVATYQPEEGGEEISFEDNVEVSTLPYLPLVNDRSQLGLFARAPLKKGSVLVWDSDIGVARSDERDILDLTAHMNRRTLFQAEGFDFFQGGSEIQRSNPALLGNFFWCHTESTSAERRSHLVMPPHYLGAPNCVYITTLKGGQLCSGLMTFAHIKAGEQLLMFTGNGRNLFAVQTRLVLSYGISLLFPATLCLPLIKLYLAIGA